MHEVIKPTRLWSWMCTSLKLVVLPFWITPWLSTQDQMTQETTHLGLRRWSPPFNDLIAPPSRKFGHKAESWSLLTKLYPPSPCHVAPSQPSTGLFKLWTQAYRQTAETGLLGTKITWLQPTRCHRWDRLDVLHNKLSHAVLRQHETRFPLQKQ